jgi:hypothetical protein
MGVERMEVYWNPYENSSNVGLRRFSRRVRAASGWKV